MSDENRNCNEQEKFSFYKDLCSVSLGMEVGGGFFFFLTFSWVQLLGEASGKKSIKYISKLLPPKHFPDTFLNCFMANL